MFEHHELERLVNRIVRSERPIALFILNNQLYAAPTEGKMSKVYLEDDSYVFVGTYDNGLVEADLIKDIGIATELDRQMSMPIARLVQSINRVDIA